LSLVGLASATGMNIDVPHIIRILAADLNRDASQDFKVTFNRDLNIYLDSGAGVEHGIPKKYKKAWWLKNRDPFTDETMVSETIEECLAHHRPQCTTIRLEEALSGPRPALQPSGPPELSKGPASNSLDQEDCQNCIKYWNVADNSVARSHKTLRHLKLEWDTFMAQRDSSARRAAGFLKLYEAAVEKELQGEDISAPSGHDQRPETSGRLETAAHAGRIAPMIVPQTQIQKRAGKQRLQTRLLVDQMQSQAMTAWKNSMKRQEELGSISQWSFGADLDRADIVEMMQWGPSKNDKAHSGYRVSHPDGAIDGSDSVAPSMSEMEPRSEWKYSDSSEHHITPPDIPDNAIPFLMDPALVGASRGTLLVDRHVRQAYSPTARDSDVDEETEDHGNGSHPSISDEVYGPEDILGLNPSRHSLGSGPAQPALDHSDEPTMSDEEYGPDDILDSMEVVPKVLGKREDDEDDESDEDFGPANILGTAGGDEESEEDFGPANILGTVRQDEESDEDFGPENILSTAGQDEESDEDFGPQSILSTAGQRGSEDIGPDNTLGMARVDEHDKEEDEGEETEDEYDPEDILCGTNNEGRGGEAFSPEDILGTAGQEENDDVVDVEDSEDDDIDDTGLAERILTGGYTEYGAAGPGIPIPQGRSYNPADFRDIPSHWFGGS
jgi:hypothetical protein